MSKKRDKREARRSARESTNRRLANHNQGFESTTVDLPKDVKRFTVQDEKPISGDILNYVVGKGNPYADEGMLHWERTFHIHRSIGPDMKPYVCPQMESGGKWNWPGYATGGKKKCPVCKEIIRLHNDGDEDNKPLIDAIKLQERQLVNWKEAESEEVKVWDFSHFPLGDLIDTELRDDPDEEYGDFSDWEKGKSLRIKFEESSFGKSNKKSKPWYKPKSVKFINRKEQYESDEIEKKVHCLDDFIKVLEPDELEKIFLQSSDEDEEKEVKFKESDVKKIKNMSEKELKKFVYAMEMDVNPDDCDTLEELRKAVLAEVKESLEEGNGKASKKTDKKASKKKDEDEDDEEEEVEDEDEESDDEDEDSDSDDEEEESDDDEESEEDEDEDSDEDSDDEDEESEDEDEEDEDDEEEEEAPKKKKPGRPAKKK